VHGGMGSGSGLGTRLGPCTLYNKGDRHRYSSIPKLGGVSVGRAYSGSSGKAGGGSVVGWREASNIATSSVSTASMVLQVAGEGELYCEDIRDRFSNCEHSVVMSGSDEDSC
jgi:hypothetical protein